MLKGEQNMLDLLLLAITSFVFNCNRNYHASAFEYTAMCQDHWAVGSQQSGNGPLPYFLPPSLQHPLLTLWLETIPSYCSYLGDAVLMGDDPHDIVQRQQRVALDLRVDVLALSADSKQFYQVDVVH